MQIAIRDYFPEDFLELSLLWESCGVGGIHRGDTVEIVQNTIRNGGKMLVAVQKSDEKLVGSTWLTNDQRRIYLHHCCVHQYFRRMGIAERLVRESINYTVEQGLQIKLEVHQSNLNAIALYSKLGFSHLGDYMVLINRNVK